MSYSHLSPWRRQREVESIVPLAEAISSLAPAPLENHLLAALPYEDYCRLLPDLEPFPLQKGLIMQGEGGHQTHLYFITKGVVSRYIPTEDGKTVEFATTGNEGVIGTSLYLGNGSEVGQAVVIIEGFAFRLRANVLKPELAQCAPLLKLLLQYAQSLMKEIGQVCACNRHHSVRQQLCRCLLSLHDRASDNMLPLTQEVIANLLGVRREAVTEQAGWLQHEGMINYHRGHITLLDRRGLEQLACECYPIIRHAHEYLPAKATRCATGTA